MRNLISVPTQNILARLACGFLLAGTLAACSNDASRLSAPVFTNSTGASRAATASYQPMPPAIVGQGSPGSASSGAITQSDLPPPAGGYSPPASAGPASGRLLASAPSSARTVKVESGDTFNSIAKRHNVSVAELLKANNLPADAKIKLGQSLAIPSAAGGKSIDKAGESPAKVAAATQASGAPPSSLGTIPANDASAAKSASAAKAVASNEPASKTGVPVNKASTTKGDPQTTASLTPAGDKSVASIQAVTAAEPADAPSADGQQFRWPVRGRIISGFGSKSNGEKNDGINLAVPEGTSVKAAEAGTVIYSGSEIAGYGNLILVRHAGGWVSAYAHNANMLVKRGDVVKRGQGIAIAGATGTVTSPQVHFELRRGSNPVNPLDFLAGA